ncbi:DinB family protein [Melghirimyces profundicolus]|uniref:DinB family protein n=1 Tax=Melghirimyces profundicolus TaxID=1242148 RepID=UPI001475637B|nr:DinB family protein [Melghirimyces profundicolus]
MSYKRVLLRFREMDGFVQSLKEIPEAWWRMPIAEGKWSPAEIIAHLIEWDRFLLDGRLDQLKPGQAAPPVSVQVDGLNARAARWAREEASRQEVPDAFHHTRTRLLRRLETVPGPDRVEPFTIRGRSLTLTAYLEGLADHEDHHRKQIEGHLRTRREG